MKNPEFKNENKKHYYRKDCNMPFSGASIGIDIIINYKYIIIIIEITKIINTIWRNIFYKWLNYIVTDGLLHT